jgi:cytidyltransferase-like protein
MPRVMLTIGFDNPGSRDIRLLQEASRLGEVHALLWSDAAIQGFTGKASQLPAAERLYFLQAIRYVREATIVDAPDSPQDLPAFGPLRPDVWVEDARTEHPEQAALCQSRGLSYHMLRDADLTGFPETPPESSATGRRKVLVTGSFDWFHSGHVRFFEEVSELGDLHVVVGHDRNIRLLKGEGHPLFPEQERSYLAGSIRFVKQALISTGNGWLDAEPEIERLKPDIYAVNEDGDKPEKRDFCQVHGIEYRVLKRIPKEGLTPRSSTVLRGF